jgi:arylesterase/paraoxonase
VEIFEIADSALVHRESIAGSLLLSPNDLVAVGPRSFYATNDHGSRSEFGRLLEDYLRLPRANVVYFDGSRFSVAADGLRYANGINVSPDGFTLYVAATTDFGVHVYSRDPLSGLLTKISTITTKTAVDNIEIDGDGNLWVTAHPKLLTFVKHSKDARRRSPSQILKITPTGASYQIDEIFLDDGRWISGSSVGAVFKNKRLIGSVFEPHILLCEFQTQ